MTTHYRFTPSSIRAPSFMPTFDGTQYNVTVIWNISSQRYYVQCLDMTGNLIFFVPLIQTEDSIEITSLVWDEYETRVVATTKENHNLSIGEIVNATITGALPANLNSTGYVLITDKNEFTFSYPTDPNEINICGAVSFLVSMTKGYFNSTLVFRWGRFEVSP
jgi:hypothetical protein